MLPESCALIGAVIGSLGGVYYLIQTLLGKAQPNRVTWLLWGLFPLVIFAAQRAQGVGSVSWASFLAGFVPLLVVAASAFNAKAYWKTEPRDYALMAAALVGLALWALTDRPNLALAFSVLADGLASVPTLIKAYRHPRSESWEAYALSAFGFGMSLASIRVHTLEHSLFLAYVFLLNATLALLASRGRRTKSVDDLVR
jgi:hypothetical protein